MKITLAHSPDSDDAFMFFALAKNRIDTGTYEFEHILKDIESLNQKALNQVYDISAISLHAYPTISEHYQILPCGGSVGNNYGPMVVSQSPMSQNEFQQKFHGNENPLTIAIPGEKTTAFLALTLFLGKFNHITLPFDQIMPAVLEGKVDAGLIIHEGQLNYSEFGLHNILDLGAWWNQETSLPLPLGANVIRKSLGQEHINAITSLIRQSIEYGLSEAHKEEALEYSMQFARGLDSKQAKQFIDMYVNQQTVDFDPDCLKAINLLYEKAAEKGLMPRQKPLTF